MITQDDFKKIWASTSSVPEYTFSDSDYQDGWEFVGNLPPTRAMWDTLQRRNDQKMKYLQDNGSMCFDSVADMVASNLESGQTVITKGYYSVNDGGSSLYTIRAKDVSDVDDGNIIIFLDNGNVAEKINNTQYDLNLFFGDTDTDRLENAINSITVGTIRIGSISIDRTINISKDCRGIIIYGGTIKLNTSVGFTGTNTYGSDAARCPSFVGCVIEGDSTKVLYDREKNIGATFYDCVLKALTIYDLPNDAVQSLYIMNCKIYGHANTATFLYSFDLKLIGNQIESAACHVIKAIGSSAVYSIMQGDISSNLIEDRTVIPIQFSTCSGLVISKNHFESNPNGTIKITLDASLQYSNYTIADNIFMGDADTEIHIVNDGFRNRYIAKVCNNYWNKGFLLQSLPALPSNIINNVTLTGKMYPTTEHGWFATHRDGVNNLQYDSDTGKWTFDVVMKDINIHPECFKLYIYGSDNFSSVVNRGYMECTVYMRYRGACRYVVDIDRQLTSQDASSGYGISVAISEVGVNTYNKLTFTVTGFSGDYFRVKAVRPFDLETIMCGKDLTVRDYNN